MMRRTAAEVMTEEVIHVEPTAPLTRVLHLMVTPRARNIPVLITGGQLVGIISREDVMGPCERPPGSLSECRSNAVRSRARF
jgi:CBS domain-containing protein